MPKGANTAAVEELWHPARLIPVHGIKGQQEQERRATSALLAVMRAVPEFGRALLEGVAAPKARLTTYAEVQLKDPDGKLSIPDGALVVERGSTRWRALLEVKTGTAELRAEQTARYLEMARQHAFDALITISNQITAGPTDLPVPLRPPKRIGVFHLSWWRIITTAVLQHRHRGVSDPDQAWILGELIAYLDHENSGASGFQDMGQAWVRVREGARQRTLRGNDPEARQVAERWEQFLDYLALGLAQDLGREVTAARARKQTPSERLDAQVQGLVDGGELRGALRVPDAIGPIVIDADLRARQTTTSVVIDAPREGRPQARVTWLLRQLQNAPDQLRLTVNFVGTRETTSALLGEAHEYPQRLLSPTDARREPRAFEVALTRPMGQKGGRGQGSFIRDTRQQVLDFYGELVQNMKGWRPRPPKLPEQPAAVSEQPSPEPPPFVAVDEREVGEATTPLTESEDTD